MINTNAGRSHKLKIAAIVPYKVFPPKMGGQKGIVLFYKYLSTFIPVTFLTNKSNAPSSDINIECINIMGNSKIRYINPFLYFKIKKIIKEKGITDLIFEHPYYGWLILFLRYTSRVRLIIHSHNIESLRFKSTGKWWWRLLWHYEKMAHRNADINFFITDEDKQFAIEKFKLKNNKCHTITYGFNFNNPPTAKEKSGAKLILQSKYSIPSKNKILLFNGTLDYRPNLDALKIIINNINPVLQKEIDFNYSIIICGKNLPESFNELKDQQKNNIIYAGFVDDISIYFKGADIFLNPVTDGGGIKTKLVEALGYNLFCISTVEGAIGVPASITGNRLKVIIEKNWELFARTIININPDAGKINEQFFSHFYWENIAKKASMLIS